MRINYFYMTPYGKVLESSIDTDEKNYLSHTDNEVTFKDTYTDVYWVQREHIVTHSRLFGAVRQGLINKYKELIASYQKDLASYQKDLAIFENSTSYEHYQELLKKS